MSLLRDVVSVLNRAHIRHALIGAAAMAVHGVSRATADVDLLTVDPRVLRDETWNDQSLQAASHRILRGNSDDVLAGSVRFAASGDVVDVVVGRYVWQREIVDRAVPTSIGEVTLPVVQPAGIVLLKLLAGGPKDAWDIRALLEAQATGDALRAEVSAAVPRLGADARRLWARLLDEG